MEDQTKKPLIDFKAFVEGLRNLKPPSLPKKKEAPKGKKRGPGITRKAYNFSKIKRRRKIANKSRRINRQRGV